MKGFSDDLRRGGRRGWSSSAAPVVAAVVVVVAVVFAVPVAFVHAPAVLVVVIVRDGSSRRPGRVGGPSVRGPRHSGGPATPQ